MTGTKPRSYCRADKPFPVGAKAMRQLRLLQLGPMPVEWATATYERLRRGGYATLTAQGTVFITDAGRALLSGPEGRAATRPEGTELLREAFDCIVLALMHIKGKPITARVINETLARIAAFLAPAAAPRPDTETE